MSFLVLASRRYPVRLVAARRPALGHCIGNAGSADGIMPARRIGLFRLILYSLRYDVLRLAVPAQEYSGVLSIPASPSAATIAAHSGSILGPIMQGVVAPIVQMPRMISCTLSPPHQPESAQGFGPAC